MTFAPLESFATYNDAHGRAIIWGDRVEPRNPLLLLLNAWNRSAVVLKNGMQSCLVLIVIPHRRSALSVYCTADDADLSICHPPSLEQKFADVFRGVYPQQPWRYTPNSHVLYHPLSATPPAANNFCTLYTQFYACFW